MGILEEIPFRGLIFQRVQNWLGFWQAPLVSSIPPAFDKSLRFIEMKRGDGNAATCGYFADRQFSMETGLVWFRFHFPLDLKLT